MTEIEAKRKELIGYAKYVEMRKSHSNYMRGYEDGVKIGKKHGKKEGKEEARKEDLDKIDEQFSWFYGFKDNKRITIARLKRNLEELKQSLGEPQA